MYLAYNRQQRNSISEYILGSHVIKLHHLTLYKYVYIERILDPWSTI